MKLNPKKNNERKKSLKMPQRLEDTKLFDIVVEVGILVTLRLGGKKK